MPRYRMMTPGDEWLNLLQISSKPTPNLSSQCTRWFFLVSVRLTTFTVQVLHHALLLLFTVTTKHKSARGLPRVRIVPHFAKIVKYQTHIYTY